MTHHTFLVMLLSDLCYWKKQKEIQTSLLRIYGAKGRNHGLHSVVRNKGAEVRNHLADKIMCKEKSRVLRKLEEVN